jgi:hypothetical protein
MRDGSALRGEAQADGRRRRDKRQRNNQPDKRCERGTVRDGGVMRGGGQADGSSSMTRGDATTSQKRGARGAR